MCDDDNGTSVISHITENIKKTVCFLRCQYSGRLIQNQDFCPTIKHFDDLYGLLLRNRHLIYFLGKIQIKTIFIYDLLNLFCHFFHIQHSLARQTKNNIFCCCQYIYQFEMLMHHSDSKFKRILR